MRCQRMRTPAVVLAAMAVLIPTPIMAIAETHESQNPAQVGHVAAHRTMDVVLDRTATLTGQVIDSGGTAIPGATVVLVQQGHVVGRTVADAKGGFSVRGLAGGCYELIVGPTICTARVWTHGTAPPAATSSALIIADTTVVRGQGCGTMCGPGCGPGCGHGCGKIRCLLHNPWVLAAGIGAAIAIPIAAHDDDDSGS